MTRVCMLALVFLSSVGCTEKPVSQDSNQQRSNPTAAENESDVRVQAPQADSSASDSSATDSAGQMANQAAETSSPRASHDVKGVGKPPIAFRWLTESGVNFVRNDDMRGQQRIFESTGGGVGVIDFDRDGLPDLVFTGGCKLPEEYESSTPTCAIFRQAGDLKFVDCTLPSGLTKPGFCQGVAVGDYDSDGFDDVYISALGHNALFQNQGDGSFSNVTAQAGVDDPRWSTSCTFADLNLDGVLDLYVVNYLDESVTTPLLCKNPNSPTGLEQCPPSKYQGVNDRLFLGDGQGGFVDLTSRIGLTEKKGKGLGLVVADFDNQGFPEIFVANDGQANYLFRLSEDDQQQFQLEEIGLNSGVALSRSGYAQASMGIAAGDFDNDGRIDLFITNFYGDSNTLYKNLGNLQFEDITRSTGLAGPSRSVLGWGTVFVDFDFDGWLDLFVANGHVEDRTWNGRGEPFEMLAQAFRNLSNGKFEDVSKSAGNYFQTPLLGRGVSVVDLNRDGSSDLVISQQLKPPSLLINERSNPAAVKLKLVGTQSNRNGWGTKLTLVDSAGKQRQFVELMPGTSYQSSHSTDVIFCGASGDRVLITWPSGVTQQLEIPKSEPFSQANLLPIEHVIVEPAKS